jgi:chromosomal replication initiation ATPase DnaA
VTPVPEQLALDLPHAASFAREDFLRAPGNARALAMIEAWPRWPSPIMLLLGPRGAGKSHLGTIWARAAQARILRGRELAEAVLIEVASAAALLLEDADQIGAQEAALFHLLNLLRENGVSTLVTAARLPDLWGLQTPDLLSRLRLAPIIELGEPDGELTLAVLHKLFTDRQLLVEPAVVNYIALRIERSLGAAREIVAALDREALARGKRVTRAMAAKLLRDAGSE